MRWQQRDAPQLIRDRLRSVIDPPQAIQAAVPDGWTPRDPPVCTVVGDGTPTTTKGWTAEVVRVTVHARDIAAARRLMVAIDGYLLTPASRLGLSINGSTGVIATKDSRLGGAVSSATYTVASSRKVVA